MSWQEDEKKTREDDNNRQRKRAEVVSNAFIDFWNKLVEGNNKLLPEIRAKLEDDSGKYIAGDTVLKGKHHWLYLRRTVRREGEKIFPIAYAIDDGRGENWCGKIMYDDEDGLYLQLSSGYGYKLSDNDVETILIDLCTNQDFGQSIRDKVRKSANDRQQETKPKEVSERQGLFRKLFGR